MFHYNLLAPELIRGILNVDTELSAAVQQLKIADILPFLGAHIDV